MPLTFLNDSVAREAEEKGYSLLSVAVAPKQNVE